MLWPGVFLRANPSFDLRVKLNQAARPHRIEATRLLGYFARGSSVDYKFQVNLQGIIDILSQHLYSSPQIYVRELLQNGVDAIRARRGIDPEHVGEIQVELVASPGRLPTLIFQDNGIGLTVDEVHQFLATIGESSKRDNLTVRRQDFIGQFGIGLLSCFIVCDEIVLFTRSVKEGSPTIEWNGRPDGTYTLKTLDRDSEPGTQLYLRCKPGMEDYFEPARVLELLAHFGGFLPYRIQFTHHGQTQVVNPHGPPWSWEFGSPAERRERLLAWGRETFQTDFFDCIPLKSKIGEVEGIAFVLPYSPNHASKTKHRVYLKNMLLSDSAEDLLPDWAFFVKCVVNAQGLRPTASRESFYEDDALRSARSTLGDCLRAYLMQLAKEDSQRLERLVALHNLSIKLLSVHDDECYRVFIDWLPFETSLGELRLGEIRKRGDLIRYTTRVDQFREISRVAASQQLTVINGGYVYTSELIEKLPQFFPDLQVEKIDAVDLVHTFDELTLAEREKVFEFLKLADVVLQPFKCAAEMKKFQPHDLPALFGTNEEIQFRRSLEQSKEVASPLWAGVLDGLSGGGANGYAQLCFNYRNSLVQKVVTLRDRPLLRRVIEMLYVQALLLGHHPLHQREMKLLSDGLLGLIELGVDRSTSGGPS